MNNDEQDILYLSETIDELKDEISDQKETITDLLAENAALREALSTVLADTKYTVERAL